MVGSVRYFVNAPYEFTNGVIEVRSHVSIPVQHPCFVIIK
ncbi:hypothetical protein MC7420_3498 [Coleofasciculus chthonoplastes PCC 7420]|uniref:Uncharacterized protein n=1 Tax=Coleofasciculus chthonoplastes PCC 7420 TaxID=118168 RepID=B4W090_9CYAN|nr:hypothetical protein MC7420_3498 [Coleofasciculus chthonoplastes PCC 7420]